MAVALNGPEVGRDKVGKCREHVASNPIATSARIDSCLPLRPDRIDVCQPGKTVVIGFGVVVLPGCLFRELQRILLPN